MGTVACVGRAFGGRSPAANGLSVKLTGLPDAVNKGLAIWNPAPIGYVVEEYLMEGVAPVYDPVGVVDSKGDQDPGPNGAPPPSYPADDHPAPRRVHATAPYVTRIVLYRPADATRFSGRTILEPIHGSRGGFVEVWSVVNKFYAERGDAVVAIEHPRNFASLQQRSPGRYAPLHAEDLTQVWGMIADAGRMLKQMSGFISPGRTTSRLYMTGYSFTGQMTSTFAHFNHASVKTRSGRPVFDGYVSCANSFYLRPLDVPVIRINTQSDFYGVDGSSRLADSDDPGGRRRRYEVAGKAHSPLPEAEPGSAIPPAMPAPGQDVCKAGFPEGAMANDMPLRPVLEMSLSALADWAERRIVPPRAPWIEVEKGVAKLDADGNAIGGYRMPEMRVPMAAYSLGARSCHLTGYELPFSDEKLRQLYGSRQEYAKRYNAAAEEMVNERLMLPSTRERLQISTRTAAEF